jgi:hypothetical protein
MVAAGSRLIANYFGEAIDWMTEDRAVNIYRTMHAYTVGK